MKVIIYVTLSIASFVSTTAFSQNILTSSIEWNSIATFDAQDGMIVDETTKIVSGPTKITWYASNDSIKYDLTITGSDGSWANVSQNGSITFNVKDESNTGVVQFTKAENTIKITIYFVLQDGKSIYELKVNNVNNL